MVRQPSAHDLSVEKGLKEANVFEVFSPPLAKALEEKGFVSPTDPQMRLVPLVKSGVNALLMAPTGTGKTEAAFLPILDDIIRNELARTPGIKLLYITPLRALNRDMLERMKWWCRRFDVRLGVRHGDTTSAERAGQSMAPPDILITTPETLQAMLTGRRIRDSLTKLRWVVIDEVHELAEDKRGSQLSIALARLRRIVGRDFQTIGLSATVGSPDIIAKFLVGKGRECEVVRVPVEKSLELSVTRPEATEDDKLFSETIYTFPEVAARLRIIREVVEQYQVGPHIHQHEERGGGPGEQVQGVGHQTPHRNPPQLSIAGHEGGDRAGPQGGKAVRGHMHQQPGARHRHRLP